MGDFIFVMVSRGWFFNCFRDILYWIDSIAFTLFSWVMQLVFDIAAISTSSVFNNFYEGIYSRVYAILVIFMLFKVTISMLTYLVNPDSITDKSQGIGKLSTRIIVTLVMLIAFPMLFQFLHTVQPHVLEALPRVVLGTEMSISDGTNNSGETIGKEMAFMSYYGVFFNPGGADFPYTKDFNSISQHLNDPVPGDNSTYRYTFHPIIGFVVGIVMTLIILGYCVDIAIRVFKLIILQAIAPIPIISYIDPKSSKDGAFSKWTKMVISVWLDLFIKLGVIYFVLLVIRELIANQTIGNLTAELFGSSGALRGALVLLALIIGLLFFAKDAPKFITDALGIKSAENGKLFGGLGKIMAAGAIGAGTIGSIAAGARASYLADEANGKNHNFGRVIKNVGAGLFGGAAGLKAGTSAAVGAKDHNARAAMDAMAKRNATALAAGSAGSTMFGRALSTGTGLFAGETMAAAEERRIAEMESQKSALETVKSRVSSEMVKKDWTSGKSGLKDSSGNDVYANYKSFMAAKNAASSAGLDKFSFERRDALGNIMRDASGNALTYEIDMTTANMQEGFILKNNESNYVEQNVSGTAKETDTILMEYINNANKVTGGTITDRNSVTDNIDKLSVNIMNAKRENEKRKQNDRFSGKK